MINITIEQIQYFLAIKKYNGFSMASNELCISQSSLSKQIKALETELDTVLFDRTSRSIALTDAGEEFFKYAEDFSKKYTEIIEGMKKHSISNNSPLKIGTIAVLTQYGLTSSIAAFKNKYNDIDINIIEDENEAILNKLKESEIDLAIMRDYNLPRDQFKVTCIARDELVVVTSKKHPFAKKKYVSFADLKDENFIICSKSGVYEICLKESKKHGFVPKVIHNISKIETILGLVSEGLGITIIVNDVLKPFTNTNISTNLLTDPISSDLALVTPLKCSKEKQCKLFKNFILN